MITKKWWQIFVRIAVAGLTLFILALHVGKIEDIGKALLSMRLSFLVSVVFLMFINIYIQYRKWLYILQIYYPRISKLETFTSILGGFTLGLISPGQLGELGRGLFLRKFNKLHLAGLTLLDKTFNNFVVFIAGSMAFYYIFKYPFNLSIYVLMPLSLIFSLLSLFLFYMLFRPQKIYSVLSEWTARSANLQKLEPAIQSIEKIQSSHTRVIFAFSVTLYLVIFFQFFILVEAFADYPMLPTFSAIVAAMFSKTLLPISIGDLGIREGAAVYFLGKVQVLKIHAFNASLLLFVINLLLPSIIGVFLIPRLSLFNNNKNNR